MRILPVCTAVNTQARKKMVDTTVNRVNRNALNPRPFNAVSRSAHHNIVGLTISFKPAILPSEIDFPRSIDLIRGKTCAIAVIQLGLLVERGSVCDSNSATPTGPSIGRDERQDSHLVGTANGNNNGTIGQNKRLSP